MTKIQGRARSGAMAAAAFVLSIGLGGAVGCRTTEEVGANAGAGAAASTPLQGTLKAGGGAQFWAYISPMNDTAKHVTKWEVVLQQQGGNWTGRITSDNPYEQLHTPNLSGVFVVKVTASGPGWGPKTLTPLPDSNPNVGCNSNCAAMVGIVSTPDGTGANYWTVWDAYCSRQ